MSGSNRKKNVPEGAINALFSVGPEQQVYFSKGNLQYQPSTGTWRFAERQYDYIGKKEDMKSGYDVAPDYDGWIGLFAWGSGDHPVGTYENFVGRNVYVEWGDNAISNGGNQGGLWRAMTYEEWDYLLFERDTESGVSFAKAKVNNVDGLILVSDDLDGELFEFNDENDKGADFDANEITAEEWEDFEKMGMVFLPANEDDDIYWSSTHGVDPASGSSVVIASDIFFETELESEFDNLVRLVSNH